jgi:hypothetical protein
MMTGQSGERKKRTIATNLDPEQPGQIHACYPEY